MSLEWFDFAPIPAIGAASLVATFPRDAGEPGGHPAHGHGSVLFLQERLASRLVQKVLMAQLARTQQDMEHFETTLRQAEASVDNLASLISYRSEDLEGQPQDLSAIVSLDRDATWRSPTGRFQPGKEAGVWIPPGVQLTPETRRFFVRAQRITTLFGLGAKDELLVDSWVLPLTNGEVIFWPDNPEFLRHTSADLDYRQTPWVQLTSPASNPSRRPRWTPPSYDPAARQWLISVVAPFQRDGAWAGSVGHDIELSQLFRRLLARSSGLASSFSMPLFVVDDNGQVLARPDGVSPIGASLPERYRPWLADPRHRRGETSVHSDGADFVIMAPIPTLRSLALFRLDGGALRRTLQEELRWLQIAGLMFVALLLSLAASFLERDARLRRLRQRALETRNRALETLVDQRTSDLRQANARLEQLSLQDPLTGLGNRRLLDGEMPRLWSHHQRHRVSLALVMADVDHFKSYNDLLGHLEGDRCLQQVAKVLESIGRRPGDLLCRYGGEEFLIVLAGADADAAVQLAEQLREAMLQLELPHPGSPLGLVSLSRGVATTIPAYRQRSEELLAAADRALYRAKSEGRNRVSLPPPPPPQVAVVETDRM
jgi:diguanylate cyclase (GGDEF)-like protein